MFSDLQHTDTWCSKLQEIVDVTSTALLSPLKQSGGPLDDLKAMRHKKLGNQILKKALSGMADGPDSLHMINLSSHQHDPPSPPS